MKNSVLIGVVAVAVAAAAIVGVNAVKHQKPVDQPTTTKPISSSYYSEENTSESTSESTAPSLTQFSSSTSEITSESTSEQTSERESTTVLLSGPKTTTKAPVSTTTRRPSTTTRKPSTSVTPNTSSPTYINGILIVNKSYPLPQNYNPGVNSAAQSAFNTMQSAAAREGINLYIVSGFRSYSTQRDIYNNYVARDGKAAADRYSARPGHSEHQTGLAFDVNSLSQSFENTPEGRWLAANCYKYGFIIRFPKGKESITGYMYEPWHIRYLGTSTATSVYNSGLTLEEYLGVKSVYSY
ncbi:MAG: M15 family metallopeptidase [Clostridia bacterium]|nr:M15 family metallopeptidase [Clostridia bacterium]